MADSVTPLSPNLEPDTQAHRLALLWHAMAEHPLEPAVLRRNLQRVAEHAGLPAQQPAPQSARQRADEAWHMTTPGAA